MAVRILTPHFLQLRSQFLRKRPGDDEDIELQLIHEEVTQNEWSGILKRVQDYISEIKKRMSQLREMHEEHATPRFGKDFIKEEQDIEIETRSIKELFKKCVDEIGQLGGDDADQPVRHAEERMMKNVKIALVTEINELSKRFRADQRNYIQKLRQLKERKKSIGLNYEDSELEPEEKQKLEKLQNQIYDKGFTEEQIREVLMNEEELIKRDRELEQILRSVIELQDMFQEFTTLVIEQGTLLDRIDYNIENTKEYVKQAHKELVQAEKYQKWSRLTLCLIFLVICLVLSAIAVGIRLL